MNNLNKIMFMTMMIIGTTMAVSSYSWLGMWMGLEINLLSITPLMSSTKNMLTNEAAMKYFITQALASTILLISIIMMSINILHPIMDSGYFNLTLNSSLLTKMGAAPFHFWFPEVMDGISWLNSFIMLTWQKIAPMVILMYSSKTTTFLTLVIITSMLISGIMGMNQMSMRKIMAYSSINHVGWMIGSMMFSETIWMIYFIVYAIISLNIIVILKQMNIFFVKQMMMAMNNSTLIKFFFATNFMSLGGLPPFLGFLPKWMTIQMLSINQAYLLAVIMTTTTLMTVFFYLRIMFSTILLTMTSPSSFSPSKINKFAIMMTNFISISSLITATLLYNFL